jgi:CheY-like chemotaxis protein
MGRALKILAVDDDGTATAGLKTLLSSSLGPGNTEVDHPNSFDEGDSFLESPDTYDLILFDINLGGDEKWGGIKLLVKHWQSIQAKTSKVMVYSGKLEGTEAFTHFSSGQGPFLFQVRQDPERVGEAFERSIIYLLRDRTRALCQRASLKSVLEMKAGLSSTLQIDNEDWSVDSLLAPWRFPLAGEAKHSDEAIKLKLFPGDDLIRVVSYWFKARTLSFPSTSMYGLCPLAFYHLSVLASPMDALMHDPWKNGISSCYVEAADIALKDHQILKDRFPEKFNDELITYINAARKWTYITGIPEAEQRVKALKNSVEFRLANVIGTIEDVVNKSSGSTRRNLVTNVSNVSSVAGFEFYCPAYYSEAGLAEPVIIFGFRALTRSVMERSINSIGLTMDYDGRLYSTTPTELFPYLYISLAHDGKPCPPNQSISSWFEAGRRGRDLYEAKEAFKGCGQWYVLSGNNSKLQSYETPMDPGHILDSEAAALWDRFNSEGKWNVVHVLKFGLPVIDNELA